MIQDVITDMKFSLPIKILKEVSMLGFRGGIGSRVLVRVVCDGAVNEEEEEGGKGSLMDEEEEECSLEKEESRLKEADLDVAEDPNFSDDNGTNLLNECSHISTSFSIKNIGFESLNIGCFKNKRM